MQAITDRPGPIFSAPRAWRNVWLMMVLTAGIAACNHSSPEPIGTASSDEGESSMTITITSPQFEDGAEIPAKYTCDGEDISPPLQIENIPQGTQSIALIGDDPDAPGGTWVHWVVFNLPPDVRELKENIPPDEELANGALHGRNSWGRLGYGGPCPPSGTHRYFFKCYALDTRLKQEAGIDKADLLRAMKGHILAEGRLMGTYRKQ